MKFLFCQNLYFRYKCLGFNYSLKVLDSTVPVILILGILKMEHGLVSFTTFHVNIGLLKRLGLHEQFKQIGQRGVRCVDT